MKKAILITGIIWAVLCLAGAIVEITYGIGQLTPLQSASVEWKADVALGTANICIGCDLAIAAALSLVLVFTRNSKMSKTAGLILGIVAAVLGSLVPGILFAVDSVQTRQ